MVTEIVDTRRRSAGVGNKEKEEGGKGWGSRGLGSGGEGRDLGGYGEEE